jgi:hypothetical protein
LGELPDEVATPFWKTLRSVSVTRLDAGLKDKERGSDRQQLSTKALV